MEKISLVDTLEKREWARRIRHKIFSEEQGIPERADVEGDEGALHFLAQREGVYVATGRYRVQGLFLKFERIAVLKEARGKGVATDLMLFMQALGAEEYPRHLQILHSQVEVRLFYERLGWVVLGPPFDEEGILHYLMIRPPKTTAQVQALLCYKDPSCPPEIKAHLQTLVIF